MCLYLLHENTVSLDPAHFIPNLPQSYEQIQKHKKKETRAFITLFW